MLVFFTFSVHRTRKLKENVYRLSNLRLCLRKFLLKNMKGFPCTAIQRSESRILEELNTNSWNLKPKQWRKVLSKRHRTGHQNGQNVLLIYEFGLKSLVYSFIFSVLCIQVCLPALTFPEHLRKNLRVVGDFRDWRRVHGGLLRKVTSKITGMKGDLATLSDCIFVVLQDKNAVFVIIG